MASMQPTDQELQFKKRARRRLVGAIALVLLMITVLPMILDDHGKKVPEQEIAITIPSQEGSDFTSKIIPVDPTTEGEAEVAVPLPEPKAVTEKAQESAPATPAKPQAVEVVKAEPVKADAKQETVAAEPTKKADDANAFYVQIGVYSNADSVKKLQDKLKAQGYKSHTEKIETSKGEKIRLRAGPFGSRLEAEGALAKIKDSGLSGMVVKNG